MALYRESPNSSLMMRTGSYRPPQPNAFGGNWGQGVTPGPWGISSYQGNNTNISPGIGSQDPYRQGRTVDLSPFGKPGVNSGGNYINTRDFPQPTLAELNEHTRGVDRTSVRNVSGRIEGTDIVQDAWQEQYDRYMAGLAATKEGVAAQYSPGIEGLEDEIGDLRAAAAKLGIPFDEYMAQRAEIGGDLDPAAGMTGSVKPAINKIYDDAEAEMRDVYDQINLNLGEQVTKKLVQKVSAFEGTMEDIIRTDETAIDLLHERSSEYAQALAQAAYSGDMYAALEAETKINAQLDFKIKETQEDLERQKKAMAAAIQAATDAWDAQYQWGEPVFDDVVQKTWDEYLSANNIPEHERALAFQTMNDLLSDKSISLNESTFRRGLTEYMNRNILNSLGVSDAWIEQTTGDTGNSELLELMSSKDLGVAFVNGQTGALSSALSGLGMSTPQIATLLRNGSQNADSLKGITSAEGKHLRNMYTQRTQISTGWEDIVAKFGPTVDETQVARAPNGFTFPIVGGGKYSDSFGYKRSAAQRAAGKMSTHQGIDIMAAKGSQLVAPVDGTVVSMDYSNIGGNYVKIKDKAGNIHYMAHLNALARNIQPGSSVRAGTFVGTVGNTGNARDTSPHLHYEIRLPNGSRTNPYTWLKSTSSGGTKRATNRSSSRYTV